MVRWLSGSVTGTRSRTLGGRAAGPRVPPGEAEGGADRGVLPGRAEEGVGAEAQLRVEAVGVLVGAGGPGIVEQDRRREDGEDEGAGAHGGGWYQVTEGGGPGRSRSWTGAPAAASP